MIVFIPCSGEECKPGEKNSEWLPRQCPYCGQVAIIGHGWRRRQAHDRMHDWIRVRRGICNQCDRTLTVLPCWCVPRAHYSLVGRLDAMRRLAEGLPVEQAAPQCRDPDSVADSATIRRWAWRRIESLRLWMAAPWTLFRLPTLVAWDWRATLRTLVVEPFSP